MATPETAFQTLSTVVQSISDVEQPLDAKIQSVLEIAAETLGFPIAYFTDIDDDRQRIVATVGSHDAVSVGDDDPLAKTYCRKPVAAETPVVVTDAAAEGWEDDPAFDRFGFSCYMGAPVSVAGETFGTICFADDSPRPDVDSELLAATVEALAGIIGYEIARSRATEEKTRQQRRYRNLFDESRDAVLLLDLDRIRECNEAACELFDIDSRETLLGTDPGDLSPPTQPDGTDSASGFAAHVETALADGEALFQWRFQHSEAGQFHAEVKLSRIELDGETLFHTHIRDISERRQREQDLRLFKNALEQAGHGVVITNRAGDIEYANPAYLKDTGYELETILGKNPRFSKSGKHDEGFYAELWETICSGEVWETEELINRRKSGELYHVDQTIAPITNEAGEITHFVGIQREITDLRMREQRLNVLNRILRHNLRNSMTVIRGNLAGIESAVDADEQIESHLTTIDDRIDQLTAISDKASKLQSIFSEDATERSCDLKAVVDAVVAELTDEFPEATVTTTLPETDVSIGYDNGIEFAISEAVENAIVHNDGEPADAEVSIELLKLPTWVVIRIADNGPGIPKQDRKSLESGEETEITHASSIGLWVMYWVVKASGGDVNISDNDPSGTIIDMLLPRSEKTADTTTVGTDTN